MANKPQMNLDDAIKAMREDAPQMSTLDASADRVWQRITEATGTAVLEHADLASCEGIRSELSAQRHGQKNAARAMLVESHLHECANCRAYAAGDRSQAAAWSAPVTAKPMWTMRAVAMAATVLFVVGLTGSLAYYQFFSAPAGPRATLMSVNGQAFLVSDKGERALKPGEQINEGQLVRTAANSRAFFKLVDGSIVEVNERTQFGVKLTRTSTTIALDRGKVLVQAAKRRTGHLYVDSDDVHVSVTGTIFSVNHGTKGSRVAVVEGEVRVEQNGGGSSNLSVLHPGDQVATSADMGSVPVSEEISWSANKDEYLKMLGELSVLAKKFEQIQLPGLRYQSRIINYVPDNTVLYAGVPNYGDALAEAHKIFTQQLAESETLRNWWAKHGAKNDADLTKFISNVQELSHYLGDEIVLSMATPHNRDGAPLIVSELKRSGIKEFVEGQIAANTTQKEKLAVRWLDENSIQSAIQGQRDEINVLIHGDFIAMSPNVEVLKAFDRKLTSGEGTFGSSDFGQRVASLYQDGAGLFVAANLGAIRDTAVRQEKSDNHQKTLAKIGADNVQYVIVHRKDVNGKTDNRAQVTFAGDRHGVASWLAAPAPIGSLEYISADARAASAGALKNPVAMFDDIFSNATQQDIDGLTKAQSELGINLRDDLAASLGSDFTFALDGPVLPTPAWRFVMEVNDSNRLQGTIENLIVAANKQMAKHPDAGSLDVSQEIVNGRTFYAVKKSGGTTPVSMEIHYTYSEGYLVAAPTRAFVMAALQTKESGMSLARSQQFRALLPASAHTNFSAMLYQNLAPVMETLMQNANDQQAELIQKLASDRTPTVIAAFGEQDRIEVASTSKLLGLDLRSLAAAQLIGMNGTTKKEGTY